MKFGAIPLAQAEGALLGHSVRCDGLSFSKGRRLAADDVEALRAAGLHEVIALSLDPGDIEEDAAAQAIADAIARDHLDFSPATTGRVNIFARCNGLFVADKTVVNRLNRIHPAITLACLRDHAEVKAGDMVATIKIIPLAAPSAAVDEAVRLLRSDAPFAVKPYKSHSVALVATQLPTLKPSVMDKTARLLEARLRPSGSLLAVEERVDHSAAAVTDAIGRLAPAHDLVIVFGASALADFDDVIPAAIRAAGGTVTQAGLPVDPGNLLVLGEIGATPIIGAPGCARSPKENGFDWVLSRIFAGETPDRDEMTSWGVGGLLMEIPTRPRPRLGDGVDKDRLSVAAVVLAAGQARRMGEGGPHKLLALFDGLPLVRRSTETALAVGFERTVVVTGHRAAEIEAALSGLDCETAYNPDYASGMASSLRTGLSAVADRADGVIVLLADMPAIASDDLQRLLAAFRAEGGEAIIRAVADGKRGNPVILPKSTFAAIARLEGDIGARPIIEKSGLPVIDVEIGAGAHLDTDTPEAILAAGGVLAG